VAAGKDGKPADHYAALWVKNSGDDDARIYVGITAELETEVRDQLKEAKLIPRTLHAMIGSDGGTRYCGVWGRPPATATTGQTDRYQFEGNFKQKQADLGDQLLIDVAVSGAGKPQTTRDRLLAAVKRADTKLKTKPDDGDARLSRALAHFHLGDNQKALDDLQVVIGKNPESVPAKEHKVRALAALGKKQDAQSELAKFQKEDAPEHSKLFLVAALAAELGEGADKALETVAAAVRKQPENADLRYDGARAFSVASKSISRSDKAKARQLAERCLELLREAVKNDDADFGKIDEDADLDPIRDLPAIAGIMKVAHPERRYAAVWSSDASFEAVAIYGLDPAAHETKCRELIAQGYRPASWSVSRTTSEGLLVTASVWHRPVVSEEFKDRLTERQARAAVALVRVGQAESIAPASQIPQGVSQRDTCVEYGCQWLDCVCTDAALRKLVAGWRALTPEEVPRPCTTGPADPPLTVLKASCFRPFSRAGRPGPRGRGRLSAGPPGIWPAHPGRADRQDRGRSSSAEAFGK
jgi:tetratricopeptide (TPR) repeat protein